MDRLETYGEEGGRPHYHNLYSSMDRLETIEKDINSNIIYIFIFQYG